MAVIAFVDGTSWDSSVVRYAVWAAQTIDQPLKIVAYTEEADVDPPLVYDSYQQMSAREEMFLEMSGRAQSDYSEPDTESIEIAQSSARMARELGIPQVKTTQISEPIPEFVENSTDSGDLLVAARHDSEDSSKKTWLDQFLRLRKRVVLLVPESYGLVESWFLAYDGKPSIGRAVDFLATRPLLRGVPGRAVYVGNEYTGKTHFRDALKHLEGSGLEIQSHQLSGNADDVLAAVLTVNPVDLLVMGAYGQGRFRMLAERSTTSRLFREFRGPVVVARS